MKTILAFIALALTSCAGLNLGVGVDPDGNVTISGTIPQAEK